MARKPFLLKRHYTVAIFHPFAPKTDIRFNQCFSSKYSSVCSFWIKSYLESSKKHIWEKGILNISDCWNWWFECLLSAIENILAKSQVPFSYNGVMTFYNEVRCDCLRDTRQNSRFWILCYCNALLTFNICQCMSLSWNWGKRWRGRSFSGSDGWV